MTSFDGLSEDDLAGLSDVELFELERLIDERKAKEDFIFFCEQLDERFVAFPHVQLLADKLEKVKSGDIKKLMVWMPPRHSKSFLASHFFPAWWLFNFPNDEIMLCSYNGDLARKFSQGVRDLVRDNEEFLGLEIDVNMSAKDFWGFVGHKGSLTAAGVNGTLTGQGCNVLIIDDPVKNAEEAYSPAVRRKTVEWYQSTALSRLEPGGAQIIIQTRWHDDDLSGQVLEADREGWHVVKLPAICEEPEEDPLGRKKGDALCPDRYDSETLKSMKNQMGNTVFSALYQQNPTPQGGSIFKSKHEKFYSRLDNDTVQVDNKIWAVSDCVKFVCADTAISLAKTADYTVLIVFLLTPDDELLIFHLERGRFTAARLIDRVIRFHNKWRPSFIGVEKTMASISIIDALRSNGVPVKVLVPDINKISRSLPAQIRMEQGKLFFPDPDRTEWFSKFADELYRFPAGKFDDQVDALAWGCELAGKMVSSEARFTSPSVRRNSGADTRGRFNTSPFAKNVSKWYVD